MKMEQLQDHKTNLIQWRKTMPKKNEIYETTIEDVIFPNKGIAHIDDKKVIVKNAIKGQKVKVRITKKRKDKIEATILEILERASMKRSLLSSFWNMRRLYL